MIDLPGSYSGRAPQFRHSFVNVGRWISNMAISFVAPGCPGCLSILGQDGPILLGCNLLNKANNDPALLLSL